MALQFADVEMAVAGDSGPFEAKRKRRDRHAFNELPLEDLHL